MKRILKNNLPLRQVKSQGNILIQALFSSLVAFGLVTTGLTASYYFDEKDKKAEEYIETDQIVESSLIVMGEKDSKEEPTSFSSENFQIKQISLGDGLIVSETIPQENFLKISNIKGEAYVSEQNKKNFKILITWQTNQPARFEVVYYPIANKKNKKTLKDSAYNMKHATVIDSLDSGESYVYQIHCFDRRGEKISSEPRSILSSSEPVLITDLINKAFKDTFGWAMKN